MPSDTRRRFLERKKAGRAQRQVDQEWPLHHFYCQGQRRRRGKMATCAFEVRFSQKVQGAVATCSFCRQIHVYATAEMPGVKRDSWLRKQDYDELYIPVESLVRVEDVYREIDVEAKVKTKDGTVKQVPEKLIVADHAPWCKKQDISLAGLAATVEAPGRVRWKDSKGNVGHVCLSSEAARQMGLRSAAVARERAGVGLGEHETS